MSELPALIQALLKPQAYPEPPSRVELVQTQISYVFLADEFVYKIKKPVDMGFLDYSTLEKRLHLCNKEVELNRRLCANAYLGVFPITNDNGQYHIDGKGKVEEYAVKMRRLPQDAMMDALLKQNKVTPQMVSDVAALLVDFHKKAAGGPEILKLGGIDAHIFTTKENFDQTEKYFGFIIAPETYHRLKDYNEKFIAENMPLFRKREREGRIKDCHGDLHTNHICFYKKGICIYDCIEFIDRLRYTDVAAEVAFLAMDLDHYHRSDLSKIFVDAYVKSSGDKELLKLLNFYKCYRAYVRGKVTCFQYDDPHIPDKEKDKIIATAASYFRLAESYIED
jgi:uncharacterized protein